MQVARFSLLIGETSPLHSEPRVMAFPWLPTSFHHSLDQAFPAIRRENEYAGLCPVEIHRRVLQHRTFGRDSGPEGCDHVADRLVFRCRMKALPLGHLAI